MADFEFPGEDAAADDGLEPKEVEPISSDGGESEPLSADTSTVPSTSVVPSPTTVPPTTSVPSPTTAVAPDNSVPYYPEQDPIEPDYDEPAPQR
ncbi:MAG: hypothetical protein QOG18_1237, partial [Microbacteriaceae bacterium]|nr:hypothetical protein [Microbacteriaceae bacterium]